jgi:predicted DCC family thiol-disulfide oxidoreductase YuxK
MDGTSSAVQRLRPERRATVLYDRDCGFCRWSLAWVLGFDFEKRLRPVALQEREAKALLPKLDPETLFASAHLVLPDGTSYSGGDAVAPVLRLLPGGLPLSIVAGALSPFSRLAYRWIARYRGPLGRALSAGMVARATAQIDARRAGR